MIIGIENGHMTPKGFKMADSRNFPSQQGIMCLIMRISNRNYIQDITSSSYCFSPEHSSGCSRSMTGNKDQLNEFQAFHGGKVTFGGGEGRISGKGTIRIPTLDFENVYYVKELQQFNLFSISQICDKKNQVLFTDTECLVISKDFKLPDDSMIVLKVPRKHNLYTINLNDEE
nr:ribonuclease H-like domain-containing protein [Tanacetum cinerariifolium]